MKWETPGTFVMNLIYVVLFVIFYCWFFWELSGKWGVQ
jgi:hypothetical protein